MTTAPRSFRDIVAAAATLATLTACLGDGGALRITGTSGGGDTQSGANGSGSVSASALVGRWSRIVIFDAAGQTQASETIWEFAANGAATRTVIASNLTAGIADAVVAHAQWTLRGTSIVITFLPPDSGVVIFNVRIAGSTLTLDGRDFRRTGF